MGVTSKPHSKLFATVRAALSNLRYSNEQPNLTKSWMGRDAIRALDSLEEQLETHRFCLSFTSAEELENELRLKEQLETAQQRVRRAGGDIRHLEEQLEKNQKDYEDHVAAIFEQYESQKAWGERQAELLTECATDHDVLKEQLETERRTSAEYDRENTILSGRVQGLEEQLEAAQISEQAAHAEAQRLKEIYGEQLEALRRAITDALSGPYVLDEGPALVPMVKLERVYKALASNPASEPKEDV